MNAKWKTNYNAHTFPKTYEENNMPSATIPDQSLSVKDILTRYAQGLPISGQKVPVYNGEIDIPDLDRLDISERAAYLESVKTSITRMQRDLAAQATPQPVKESAPPSGGASVSA